MKPVGSEDIKLAVPGAGISKFEMLILNHLIKTFRIRNAQRDSVIDYLRGGGRTLRKNRSH